MTLSIVAQADIVRTLGRIQYHKFHTQHTSGTKASSDDIMPSSRDDNYVLNRLQQLVDSYPAYVTLTSTQKLFGDDERDSYALIIQDKQAFQDAQDQSRKDDVSFEQSKSRDEVESGSNINDALHWLHQSVLEDDTVVTGTAASTQEDTASEKVVSSNTTALEDIILSSADIGDDNVIGLAKLMLKSASCEFMDDDHNINSSYIDNSNVDFKSDLRLQCRNNLKDEGVDSQDIKWLANLVLTRRTIILPTARAHGGGGMNLPFIVVACISLLAVLVSMTFLISKRTHRSRIWVEEEAKRQIAEVNTNCDCVQKSYTRELTSFDEELTVQLIEPSHSVVLV